ncbi:hypothetical protein [Fructobacillus evanidus]|uniref:hypothetical protein n=1 Tax=Fructobacillus evanidus TaxID=3064281 RepID=UPI0030C88FFD
MPAQSDFLIQNNRESSAYNGEFNRKKGQTCLLKEAISGPLQTKEKSVPAWTPTTVCK